MLKEVKNKIRLKGEGIKKYIYYDLFTFNIYVFAYHLRMIIIKSNCEKVKF